MQQGGGELVGVGVHLTLEASVPYSDQLAWSRLLELSVVESCMLGAPSLSHGPPSSERQAHLFLSSSIANVVI